MLTYHNANIENISIEDITKSLSEVDSGGGAGGARAPFFLQSLVGFFFAITLKNYKLCSSSINACKH